MSQRKWPSNFWSCKLELFNQPACWNGFEVSCRSLFPEGCVLSLSLTIPNLVWFSRALFWDVCSQLQTADRKGAIIREFEWTRVTCLCEVCSKTFYYFRVLFSIIKLAQDAFRELVEFNSCKYKSLIATHYIVIFRINFTLLSFVVYHTSWKNKCFEVGQVY